MKNLAKTKLAGGMTVTKAEAKVAAVATILAGLGFEEDGATGGLA